MRHHRYLIASGLTLLGISSAMAATPVDLSSQSVSVLQSFTSNLNQVSSSTDFNQTQHIRIKQTYQGYPVWSGNGVVHVPRSQQLTLNHLLAGKNVAATMNGTIYQNLQADLAGAFPVAKTNQVLQHAATLAKATLDPKTSHATPIVYIDDANKAHWAFLVELYTNANTRAVAKPTYILDANTFAIYESWNNLQTIDVKGGGFGGNLKVGKFTYDGLSGNLSALNIDRDANGICYFRNADVIVKDVRSGYQPYEFNCAEVDATHGVYWNGEIDAVNGGYSPSSDAMFAASVIKNMYQDWYKEVPLKDAEGNPMMLVMSVHLENFDNAYWDGSQMVFGDGETVFYPLVSLGVAAHEISHGFTEQHSGLVYSNQSGGMNEAFSDMAAQAAEYFAYGHNSWQIGPEIFKAENAALRYMDQPSKDCEGRSPGSNCSIDNAKQYKNRLDVHYSSGVYNRLFYLLATSKNWNTKMAFDVMVQANQNYWVMNSTFVSGGCDLLNATKDYSLQDKKYNVEDVKAALKAVGIKYKTCK